MVWSPVMAEMVVLLEERLTPRRVAPSGSVDCCGISCLEKFEMQGNRIYLHFPGDVASHPFAVNANGSFYVLVNVNRVEIHVVCK